MALSRLVASVRLWVGGSTGTAGTVNAIANPPTYNLFASTLTASYEVDFWGRYRALHDAARMAAEASRYDRGTIELTVMTTVASTYFQVLELRDRLQVAQNNLGSAQATLDDLRAEEQLKEANANIRTARAVRADVPVYLEGLGTVQAYYTVTITPRVDGQLEKVTFAEGSDF